MKSKEMFEALGYIVFEDGCQIINSSNNQTTLTFNDKTKKVEINCWGWVEDGDCCDDNWHEELKDAELNVSELKAIVKRTEELGWLDEK